MLLYTEMCDMSCPLITYSEIKNACDSFCPCCFFFFIYIVKCCHWFVTASVPGSEMWAVSCVDVSRQPRLCAERCCTVGVDPLARVTVWKWHHFVSSVHESGIASPVNSMNYVWQEKVKAMFCIICRLFSKLTFGQPFAGFRRGSGFI